MLRVVALVGAVALLSACSEPAPIASPAAPSAPERPVQTPVNHEAIVQDPVRTQCLEQTAGRQYTEALATCRRLVQRSRNPLNVASLANALSQSVIDGGADATALLEAKRLVREALHSAPAHPQRELWEEPAWATAAEVHAALGDEARMNEAIVHLTWDSQIYEQQDRRYYAELLRRAAQR